MVRVTIPDFKKELTTILQLLEAKDQESQYLGYGLLRTSEFKRFMYNKVWSDDKKSFYRFRLYGLNLKHFEHERKAWIVKYYNDNKINFAARIIDLYLQDKLFVYV